MDSGTVDATDFGNAGSATISIVSITESSPGVFQVAVMPTSPGTLQLQILPLAILKDPADNALNTEAAILDETILTVEVAAEPPVGVRRLRVYLLGGQSNAAGRGDSSGLPTSPVNLQQAQEDVDFYDGAPLTTLRPRSQFGPEITLGRRLSESIGSPDDTRVAILKYGVGGTSLKTDWKPGGDATTAGDGPRYVSFQQVVADGLAALGTAYPDATIEIEGMLWVQGERDARDLDHGEYETNLNNFIADVRETYGAGLPFVVMRLASGQTNLPAVGLAGVRAAQTAVAAADPRVPLVDSDGFSLQSDALHFDALGQQQLGETSALLFLELLPFATPPVFEVLENGDFKVSIDDAFPDFLYSLETNSSLQDGGWTELESAVSTGSSVSFTLTPFVGEERRFFRLKRSTAP